MKLDINIGNEHILEHFPNFEYFNCTEPERLKISKTDNLVGSQQRAFVLYHIIQEVKKHGEIGISLGCGQVIEPWTIGADHYCGDNHFLYGGEYYPHLTSKCEKLPFNDATFAFVVAHHSFEHMEHPLETFKEWLRILKSGGALIMVVPDADYENKEHPWDKDHHIFFTPNSFRHILEHYKDLIQTEVFNNFHNSFSFNYVGRKR